MSHSSAPPHPSIVPLLRIDALQVVYQSAIVALQGVDLAVHPGEFHALLGANGAGKSTVLKAVSQLLAAHRGHVTTGSVQFDGQDVLRTAPSTLVRRGLVQVLEGRHCFPSLSVEDNLLTGALGAGARRSAVAPRLEKVYALFPRLKERRRSLAGLTSGGEQQMTAIGRALMAQPRLLVLDEPSMGLAPLVVQDIFRQLQRLNHDEGLSILVAEQNSAVALRYAHHATVLDAGRSVVTDTVAALRQQGGLESLYLGQLQAEAPDPVAA